MGQNSFHKQINALAEICMIFRFQIRKAGRNVQKEEINKVYFPLRLPPKRDNKSEQNGHFKCIFLHFSQEVHPICDQLSGLLPLCSRGPRAATQTLFRQFFSC